MNDYDNIINKGLRMQHETDRRTHSPSGRLSAGYLGKPLREQVLKVIGVPEKPVDDYVLRLFARGHQVEEWYLNAIQADELQVQTTYTSPEGHEVVGVIDGIKDDTIIEVKSVKNSQLKWLKKEGAKLDHALQATLYAMAEGKEQVKVVYVSAEDFQTHEFDIQTDALAVVINATTLAVYDQILNKKTLPDWKPIQEWHESANYPKYSSYPDWVSLDTTTAMDKLKREYPESYKKLTGGKL